MVLVIDTSSAMSALALIEGGTVLTETVAESGRVFDTGSVIAQLLGGRARKLSAVAIALGPGSFTGVRSGISFGLGLAHGLQIPLLGLGTLELVAARAQQAVTALSEAGRGRVYYLAPDGRTGVGGVTELPTAWPLAGWTRPATALGLLAGGHEILPEELLLSFATAAATLLDGAQRVAYDRVKPAYMSPFGGLA